MPPAAVDDPATTEPEVEDPETAIPTPEVKPVAPGDDGAEHEDEGELGAQLIGPSPRLSQALIRSALVDEPWAIKRSWLATMLRADDLPLAPHSRPEPVAASSFERIGGQMVASAAVLPIHGLITQRYDFWSWLFGGTSIDVLRGAVRETLADPAVSAVIFDIDSPGGSVDGLTEFAKELRSLRGGAKPIVSVIDPLAASAAVWIGFQADEVVITPSGEVGSIGVYAAHEDDSAALEMAGIKITLVSAGKYKTEGNPFEPLGDEAEAAIQEQVDTFYAMFLSDVALGRGISVSAVASGYGEGRTMLAKKALQARMVDRIDTLENTALRLGRSSKAGRLAAGLEPTPLRSQSPIPEPAAIAASVSRPDRAWNARMAKRTRRHR
jgi:signal peptide peptidase SppA